ncbi:MAG: hypothetical protein H6673_08690 [Anaerolineales bacterium]|nr:hypothetical protein [Anaerolineales bacterium]
MDNLTSLGVIFLVIFFASLVGFYIVIRRQLMPLRDAGGLAMVINVGSAVAVGLSSDNVDGTLAIIGGMAIGALFTGAMIIMATFFQNNQPENLAAYDAARSPKTKDQ